MARTPTVTVRLRPWRRMMRDALSSVVLSLVLMYGLCLQPAAAASPCRTVELAGQPHEVCILKITRSAKQYWEYRAAARVDGKTRPVESYDCRQQVRIRKDGKRFRIDQDAAGTLICRMFDH